MVRFSGDAAKKQARRFEKVGSIDNSAMLSKYISSAQGRIEGVNYDARKHTVQFDDVIRQQREIMYKQRDTALEATDLDKTVKVMYNTVAKTAVAAFTIYDDKEAVVDGVKLLQAAVAKGLIKSEDADASIYEKKTPAEAIEIFREQILKDYYEHKEKIGPDFVKVERRILIDLIDKN